MSSDNKFGKASEAVTALFTDQGTRDLGNDFQAHSLDRGSLILQDAIDLMSLAECGTKTTAPDPMLDWAYAPRDTEGVSCNGKVFGPLTDDEDEKRNAWFKWIMTYTSLFATNRNGFYAVTAKSDDGGEDGKRVVVAAAMCAPPGTVPFSTDDGEMEEACGLAGVELAEEIMQGERVVALGEWQATTAAAVGGDTIGEKFLKVEIFATAPSWQGKGCGSALLKLLGEVADADGVSAYLETAGDANVGFYEKKGGFKEVARSPCGEFKFDGGGVAMLRPAAEGEKVVVNTTDGSGSANKVAAAGTPNHWEIAVKAITALTLSDLKEITAFVQPPPGAQEVLDAFYRLCGIEQGFEAGNTAMQLEEEGDGSRYFYFGAFARIQQDLLDGKLSQQVEQYLNVTLPELKQVVTLESADSIGEVTGIIAGLLLLVPEYLGHQNTTVATSAAEENQSEAKPNIPKVEGDEATAIAAGNEDGDGAAAQQQENEQQNQGKQEEKGDNQAEEGQVTSDDVAWEFGDHYFTRADVVDVTKIQATYRRKAARKRVDEAKGRRQLLKAEEAARRQRRSNRIELPDDAEITVGAKTAAIAAANETIAKQQAGGTTTRGGFTVDYSKPLNRKDMSADTKGMQRMYSRMLKTKMWW